MHRPATASREAEKVAAASASAAAALRQTEAAEESAARVSAAEAEARRWQGTARELEEANAQQQLEALEAAEEGADLREELRSARESAGARAAARRCRERVSGQPAMLWGRMGGRPRMFETLRSPP